METKDTKFFLYVLLFEIFVVSNLVNEVSTISVEDENWTKFGLAWCSRDYHSVFSNANGAQPEIDEVSISIELRIDAISGIPLRVHNVAFYVDRPSNHTNLDLYEPGTYLYSFETSALNLVLEIENSDEISTNSPTWASVRGVYRVIGVSGLNSELWTGFSLSTCGRDHLQIFNPGNPYNSSTKAHTVNIALEILNISGEEFSSLEISYFDGIVGRDVKYEEMGSYNLTVIAKEVFLKFLPTGAKEGAFIEGRYSLTTEVYEGSITPGFEGSLVIFILLGAMIRRYFKILK